MVVSTEKFWCGFWLHIHFDHKIYFFHSSWKCHLMLNLCFLHRCLFHHIPHARNFKCKWLCSAIKMQQVFHVSRRWEFILKYLLLYIYFVICCITFCLTLVWSHILTILDDKLKDFSSHILYMVPGFINIKSPGIQNQSTVYWQEWWGTKEKNSVSLCTCGFSTLILKFDWSFSSNKVVSLPCLAFWVRLLEKVLCKLVSQSVLWKGMYTVR